MTRPPEGEDKTGTPPVKQEKTGVILVVEDNYLIAYSIADDLGNMGYDQVKILGNADEALAFLVQTTPAFGLLDVNLGQGATSMPMARKLMARGVPFACSSGYGADIGVGNEFQNVPCLTKPVEYDALEKAITAALQA